MRSSVSSAGGKRVKVGTLIIVLSGLMLLASAGAKIPRVPQVVEDLGAMGFTGGRLTFITMLEIVCALLFLVPATRSIGLLLVSSFLGGAIASHLQHSQPILAPAFVLLLAWLGTWLRHPGLLGSLGHGPVAEPPPDRGGHRQSVAQGL